MQKFEARSDVLNTEQGSSRERALGQLADWWGDRLIAKASDVNNLPFYKYIEPTMGIRGWVALVAHWCRSDNSKKIIQELGGVIGRPGAMDTVAHGKAAVDQINIALGKQYGTYGHSHDGFSIFYLHPLNPDDYDLCNDLYEAENPGMFYNLNPASKYDVQYYRTAVASILSNPWEPLTRDLTSDSQSLRSSLSATGLLQNSGIRDDDQEFFYKLRRLEDSYRIATV